MAASRSLLAAALGLPLALGAAGCASKPPTSPPPAAPAASSEPGPDVYRRADAARVRALEQEVERLRDDLRSAEEALVAVESGMKGAQTRAEVVSELAEARIAIDRAAARAPWRASSALEARAKLDEASRQLEVGHLGSAIFFASRASRLAATIVAEADQVAKEPDVRFVKGSRVNLRGAPSTDSEVRGVLGTGVPVFPEHTTGEWLLVRTVSGEVGWMHASLLRDKGPSDSSAPGAPLP